MSIARNKILKAARRKQLMGTTGLVAMVLTALALVFIATKGGLTVGIIIVGAIIGFPVVMWTLLDVRVGVYLILLISFFMFLVKRLTGIYNLPVGVLIDMLLITSSIGLLLKKDSRKRSAENFKNPSSLVILIYLIYSFIQLLNPNGTLAGWGAGVRIVINFFMYYLIMMQALNTYKFFKNFTKLWLILAGLCGVYGLYQEFFGFMNFEMKWMYSDPSLVELNFIWGRWRRMSFLSDSASFGIFMAYATVAYIVMAIGPYKMKWRLSLVVAAMLMIMSMSYSGTRTAYVTAVIGIALFVIMSMNNKRTVVFSILMAAGFLIIFFGPFYAAPIIRLRSTFEPKEDASFNVRVDNRKLIRPYIFSNPMGGGLATTGARGERYSPHHPLAGFPPDSGMLNTTLETGWIGLIIEYTMYFLVLVAGVKAFHRSRSPLLKNLILMYASCYFSITIANYSQEAMWTKPISMILIATMAVFIRIGDYEQEALKEDMEKGRLETATT